MPPPKDSTLPNPLGIDSDYWTDVVHNDTYPAISPSKSDLSGKAVFICGASKGIGRAITLSYAKAGASQIAIGARSDLSSLEESILHAAKEAQRKVPELLAVCLDVTDRNSIENAARQVEKAFGKIDIIVNNTGMLGKGAAVADSDPDAWWDIWTLNVRGPYLVTRAFLPLLLKGGDKQIVNIASVGAHVIGPGFSAYQTSKLALLRFTEFVQAEYGGEGVLAFSVHPGNVATDLLNDIGGVPPSLKHGMSTHTYEA